MSEQLIGASYALSKNRAPFARTIFWERCARISSWPGCNNSSLARGRIHLRKLLLTAERKTLQRRGRPYIFCQKLFQRRLVQHRLRQKLLQLAVLLFQRSQTLGVRHLHAAVFGLPGVQGGFRNAVLAG